MKHRPNHIILFGAVVILIGVISILSFKIISSQACQDESALVFQSRNNEEIVTQYWCGSTEVPILIQQTPDIVIQQGVWIAEIDETFEISFYQIGETSKNTIPWDSEQNWNAASAMWTEKGQFAIFSLTSESDGLVTYTDPATENTRTRQFYDFSQVTLIEPSTGNMTLMELPNLPDITSDSKYFYVKYAPSLRYVIYSAMSSPTLRLYDLKQEEIVWGSDDLFARQGGGNWSPDGNTIVVRMSVNSTCQPMYYEDFAELFLIDTQGTVKQVTNFTGGGNSSSNIHVPHWSPNGQYIVFWYQSKKADEMVPYTLVLLNVETREVQSLDLQTLVIRDIVWSPDSEQIAVMATPTTDDKFDLYIVDVPSGKINQITDSGDVRRINYWCNCTP